MSTKQAYIIILRRRKRVLDILFNVGNESKTTTLLRLRGKRADVIFNAIISALSRYGAVSPLKTSEHEDVFTIREDLGPIVGGFLILLRRSTNPKKWLSILNDTLEGKYPMLVMAFENYLTMAIDMSRIDKSHAKRRKYMMLTPKVLDAVSAALKKLVEAFSKMDEPGRKRLK